MQAARKFILRKTLFLKESSKLESVKSYIYSSRFNASLKPVCYKKKAQSSRFSLAQKHCFWKNGSVFVNYE